ncbi:peptidoglycan recognition protein family protein [Pseudonocardia humida]|uniref:N-acetylmuramoyl-L-alanine amidase n=1 Tax=Pseudonocardia humida TaxID=2800819 RepID=A0ABT1A1Q7_9PSEU|nr:N-acetylmuramoyl-L-alanine amidase [Pseudonocardia humida]MCO1656922.1 N-acetylmuramoyl-L-alanine amidase [Pseudonocardia humida]
MSRRTLLAGGVTGLFTVGGMALGAGTARATAERPPFAGCAEWGARPPAAPPTVHRRRAVRILVHHTATPNTADHSPEAAAGLARSIQAFHMDRRGWTDTGQHFTISRGGWVMEGRHRSVELLDGGTSVVEGSHCTGQNVVAIGIENEGTYTDTDPPPLLWERLRQTCAYICARYRINPIEIVGHRDFKNTACPGDRLYGLLPILRDEVAGLLGRRVEGAHAARATWPLLRGGDTGPEVLAAQHLLRAAGIAEAAPTGVFDPATDRAVRAFQTGTGAEEVNGLLGGESWPVLATTATRRAGDPDVRAAVRVLVEARPGPVPAQPDLPTWQRLLGTGGAPMAPVADPPR